MVRAKASPVAPTRADDAASVAAFLRHEGPRDGFTLAQVMLWQRSRVDRALAVLMSDKRVAIDAGTGRYSLVED
jgi:hypothetical protein